MTRISFFIFPFFFALASFGQTQAFGIIFRDTISKKGFNQRSAQIILNGSDKRVIKIDRSGWSESIKVKPGNYRLTILVKNYKPLVVPQLEVEPPKGAVLWVDMVPTANLPKQQSDTIYVDRRE